MWRIKAFRRCDTRRTLAEDVFGADVRRLRADMKSEV